MSKIYYFFSGACVGALLIMAAVFLWTWSDRDPHMPALLGKSPAEASTKVEQDDKVRDFILNNPTVIQEALNKLERQAKEKEELEQQKTISEQHALIEQSKHQVVIGNPNAPYTLVEFFDYNCGYCKNAIESVTQTLKSHTDLKLVLRDFPILSRQSMEASTVAIALRSQFTPDQYFDFHTRLMKTKGIIDEQKALSVAQEMGADMDKLSQAMKADEVKESLQETGKIAKALSLSGTPSFLLGDELIIGVFTPEEFEEKFQNLKLCGKTVCKKQ